MVSETNHPDFLVVTMGIFLGLLHKRNVGGLGLSGRDLALATGKARAFWHPCMSSVHQSVHSESQGITSQQGPCSTRPDSDSPGCPPQGDGNIRYYEVSTEKPHLTYLTEYRSYNPQQGIGE